LKNDSPDNFKSIVQFIRGVYGKKEGFIPLHEPVFCGNEKKYVCDCIDSTFVSSVGEYVNRFETLVADYTGSRYAVAVVNGTAALHLALVIAGVGKGDIVVTQAVSFVGTANAISHCGAEPVFLDSDPETLGLSHHALASFLSEKCRIADDGHSYLEQTGQKITACVPVNIFGHPVKIDSIKEICGPLRISVVEDAAESLGSYYCGRHTGTEADMGIISFNGNKTITTGGGGMILTNDQEYARKAKHLSTTAKKEHPLGVFP
jgi:perosamine synthetase